MQVQVARLLGWPGVRDDLVRCKVTTFVLNYDRGLEVVDFFIKNASLRNQPC